MIWLGLGMMSIQVGVMAHLTWFAYSWDIVEPISYFVSYSAVIGVYAYFVLTRKVKKIVKIRTVTELATLKLFRSESNHNGVKLAEFEDFKLKA